MPRLRCVLSLTIIGLICSVILAVDRNNFKTCEQSGFCKRFKNLPPKPLLYSADLSSLKVNDTAASFILTNTVAKVSFIGELWGFANGVLRFRMKEMNPLRQRWEIPPGDVLVEELPENSKFTINSQSDNSVELTWMKNYVKVQGSPFRLDVVSDGTLIMSVNAHGKLNFEHYREKANIEPPESETTTVTDEEAFNEVDVPTQEDISWEESFKSHTDTNPYGPSAVGLDVSFPMFENVYGIPEHADTFKLKSTKETEPYRLYNLDVFEYEVWNPMALYGSVPVMLAHNAERTVGFFWFNPSETWVDIGYNMADKGMFEKFLGMWKSSDEVPQTDTKWVSESGNIDFFVMVGPTPRDVMSQYASLTGTNQLPPLFALGYHQCRWNYNDQDDVDFVHENFDKHLMPVDVVWLDIEHTNGKRYFTWDANKFSDSVSMLKRLAEKGRKMVTIVDPHLKKDTSYHAYYDGQNYDVYVKDKHGNEFDGWCWPGSSAWPDFLRPDVREWWTNQFAPTSYQGQTNTLYTWNDMNEPSVFNGPEVTMHKDCQHKCSKDDANFLEHREVHNVYGHYLLMATAHAQSHRVFDQTDALATGIKRRPFVLSRAFFAGSQRYGAVWTGDNEASWEHLKVSIPMLLSLSVTGITFCGADVGGFFGNPDSELLVRWYQTAAFQPFFRGHAHLDTRRREPYLYERPERDYIREALKLRYTFLPYWYTLFFENHLNGMPPMRPLWFEFPGDPNTFAIDNSYMVGSGLFVHPITSAHAVSASFYLPSSDNNNSPWYSLPDLSQVAGGQQITVNVRPDMIPVFQRAGSIVPRWMRQRRSTTAQRTDPYTLMVCLDRSGQARGTLFADTFDGSDYRHYRYNYLDIMFANNTMVSARRPDPAGQRGWTYTDLAIERIVIAGHPLAGKFSGASMRFNNEDLSGRPVPDADLDTNGWLARSVELETFQSILVIRKPNVKINQEFIINLH